MTESEAVLYAEVSTPAFFEKLAAASIVPPDHDSARRLLGLGDIAVPAVQLFIEKQANQNRTTVARSIKSAVDAAFAVAGLVPAAPAAPAAAAADFLRAPKVAAAAAAYRADLIKRANDSAGPVMPGTAVLEDADEDEEKKKKDLAAASAAV